VSAPDTYPFSVHICHPGKRHDRLGEVEPEPRLGRRDEVTGEGENDSVSAANVATNFSIQGKAWTCGCLIFVGDAQVVDQVVV
jgi:hypothetical protein